METFHPLTDCVNIAIHFQLLYFWLLSLEAIAFLIFGWCLPNIKYNQTLLGSEIVNS